METAWLAEEAWLLATGGCAPQHTRFLKCRPHQHPSPPQSITSPCLALRGEVNVGQQMYFSDWWAFGGGLEAGSPWGRASLEGLPCFAGHFTFSVWVKSSPASSNSMIQRPNICCLPCFFHVR